MGVVAPGEKKTRKSHASYPHYLEVRLYKFQVVHSFTYLGSEVNCDNDISAEIQKCILAANRCFHGLRRHLRSHLTSRHTKILMYKVLIRPVLTYASETWTLSKTNERQLSLFKRKVLRCVFGAKQEKVIWRKWHNYELAHWTLLKRPKLHTFCYITKLLKFPKKITNVKRMNCEIIFY